ncbi:apolipoprotein A-I-like isoform X1 [Betta splendens]|uniref:Apolipoprotein A-I-like isoform X1 n=2 Tax=Betta splendens TaxID=158456 RepID=A0A9W2XBQ6_BETSP|nr:apolipoprotein A-I-like isoform X1 [Betta splendens]XP_055358996.1 apolipoprotein A-I-like isoform X1 [Betta splendens]XP_055358997.1 apolipoprotein A-I-like isoform X1 [Betta splendens]XP_055358998.1 apolipoprotein A-I-like isoform X1 [Betta splendens]
MEGTPGLWALHYKCYLASAYIHGSSGPTNAKAARYTSQTQVRITLHSEVQAGKQGDQSRSGSDRFCSVGADMKALVLLAVAVLSGCHANLFYADAPKPQVDALTEAFWDYIAKATQTADDTLQMIKESQFGQEVNARLAESADLASEYAVALQEQLSPAAEHLMTKISTEADVLRNALTQELSSVRDKLEPYTEDTKARIQQRMEQMRRGLAPYADSLDSGALRSTLVQKSEELKSSLEQSVKGLKAQLGPYTDGLKTKVDRHLQNLHESVAPMKEKVQVELSQGANLVKQMVAPYAEDFREKLDPYTQDLLMQLTTLYESLIQDN